MNSLSFQFLKIKYFFLLGVLCFNFETNACSNCSKKIAVPLHLDIEGQMSFNSIFFKNQKKTSLQKGNASSPKRFSSSPLFTVDDSRIKFHANGKTISELNYGFVIILNGDTNTQKAIRENYLYVENSWGKIQVGDTHGVQKLMSFGGYDQWGGTGFLGGEVLNHVINYVKDDLHAPDLVGETNCETKLTYLTPRLQGFQLGISLTPRTEHQGEQNVNSWTSQKNPKEPFDTRNIATAINFIHKFNNDFDIALSGTTLLGKTHPKFHGDPKRKKTKAYAFGGTFTYQNIGLSAEYGNNLNSHEIKGQHKSNAGQFMDLGLSWTKGPTKLSGGYFYGWKKAFKRNTQNSSFYKNIKTRGYGIAMDYKVASGLKVYFEYAHLQMNNNDTTQNESLPVNSQRKMNIKNNQANVFIVGSKIVF